MRASVGKKSTNRDPARQVSAFRIEGRFDEFFEPPDLGQTSRIKSGAPEGAVLSCRGLKFS